MDGYTVYIYVCVCVCIHRHCVYMNVGVCINTHTHQKMYRKKEIFTTPSPKGNHC